MGEVNYILITITDNYILTPGQLEPGGQCDVDSRLPHHQNQKNVHEPIMHPTSPLPHSVFTNLSLKIIEDFRSFEHSLPGFLDYRLQ